MPVNNCCQKCSRRSACIKRPRSQYFCDGTWAESGFCQSRCQPLRCFRGGPPPEDKDQVKMFEEKKP